MLLLLIVIILLTMIFSIILILILILMLILIHPVRIAITHYLKFVPRVGLGFKEIRTLSALRISKGWVRKDPNLG